MVKFAGKDGMNMFAMRAWVVFSLLVFPAKVFYFNVGLTLGLRFSL